MSADLAEFKKLQGARADQRLQQDRPALQMIRQAAVKAEYLTGDPNWDAFLSYLTAAKEQLATTSISFERILRDPTTVDHDTMMRAKIGLLECEAQIKFADAVISLPKNIRDEGEKAAGLLERIERAKS